MCHSTCVHEVETKWLILTINDVHYLYSQGMYNEVLTQVTDFVTDFNKIWKLKFPRH